MSYDYAFQEFRSLISRVKSTSDDEQADVIRYVCALISELAYYFVPALELRKDHVHRAKLVPCELYNTLVARSEGSIDLVTAALSNMDFQTFHRYTDNTLVVGLITDDILFIGFRGTHFFFSEFCGIDFRIDLLDEDQAMMRVHAKGRVHHGFAVEAERISQLIDEGIAEIGGAERFSRVFLTGHSLGGAVAALSQPLVPTPVSANLAPEVYMLASPRYGARQAYEVSPPPIQIEREGDIVPFFPWGNGYADLPERFDTDGIRLPSSPRLRTPLHLSLLFAKKNHDIVLYRRELGEQAKAEGYNQKLIDLPKI